MRSSATWSMHHDAASSGREGSPGLRLYRYAQGDRRARHAGPGRAAARPLLGAFVRVSRPQGQSHQDRLLGWHRPLPVHQAARARRILVAFKRRSWWDADADVSAVVDADRRRRLACTGAAMATGDGGMIT